MEYIPVLILMCAGAAIAGGGLLVSYIFGPKAPNHIKEQAFECGVPPHSGTKQRVSVRFYLVAILFLLFDVEAIFFFPWAVVFKKYLAINTFIMFEMAAFVGILLVGYFYVLAKGALEWE